jgi:hypothetical protein
MLCLVQAERERLCVRAVRVPGYKPRGHRFNPWHYQIFSEVVCVERGPLSRCEDK